MQRIRDFLNGMRYINPKFYLLTLHAVNSVNGRQHMQKHSQQYCIRMNSNYKRCFLLNIYIIFL